MAAFVLNMFVFMFLHVLRGSKAPKTEFQFDVLIAGLCKESFSYLIMLILVLFGDGVVSLHRVYLY